MLKLSFLLSGTLYPIFVVLKDRCFFSATFLKICLTEAPPQFLPETKRFARVKGLLKVFGTMRRDHQNVFSSIFCF